MPVIVFNDIENLFDFLFENPKQPKEFMEQMMQVIIEHWKSVECERKEREKEREKEYEGEVVDPYLELFQKNLINIKPNKAKKYLNIIKNAILEELNDAMDEQDDYTSYKAGDILRIIRTKLELDLKMCYLLRDYVKGLR